MNEKKLIEKYKNTTEVRTLEGNEMSLFVGAMSWMEIDKRKSKEK